MWADFVSENTIWKEGTGINALVIAAKSVCKHVCNARNKIKTFHLLLKTAILELLTLTQGSPYSVLKGHCPTWFRWVPPPTRLIQMIRIIWVSSQEVQIYNREESSPWGLDMLLWQSQSQEGVMARCTTYDKSPFNFAFPCIWVSSVHCGNWCCVFPRQFFRYAASRFKRNVTQTRVLCPNHTLWILLNQIKRGC